MSRSISDLSEQDYRELLEAVQEADIWCWDRGFTRSDVDGIVKKAAEDYFSAETRFRHSVSDAVLYTRLPESGSPPTALKGLLEHPFNPGLDPESSFAHQLGKAHMVIACQPENRYISPIKSSETVLSIDVPPCYNLEAVTEAAVLAGRVSLQVEALHREIRRPIETLIESR